MGLSYGPQYTWTEHFGKRAQERFGVNEERLPKWIGRQLFMILMLNSDLKKENMFLTMELFLYVIQLNKNLLLVMKQKI